MLGILIDSEEFEVKPAISRFFLLNEFIDQKPGSKKFINKLIDLTVATFPADGIQTQFSVGESIGTLFNVSINGLVQERDTDYFHIAYTSKITFSEPPPEGSSIAITYYKGRNSTIIDNYGTILQFSTEYFTYNGTTLEFTLQNNINSIVTVDINGLLQEEGLGFNITSSQKITLGGAPVVGSRIGVTYLH
jgi:hypothetical protein